MKRRTVLGLAAGVAAGLAGCAGFSDGSQSPGSSPPDVPSETPPMNSHSTGELVGDDFDFDPAATYNELTVEGRPDAAAQFRPHQLQIWNAASEQRTISVRILDRLVDDVAHKSSYAVPGDEQLTITLRPSRYYVQIWGPGIDAETLLVPCFFFDCNDSVTDISVFKNGRVRFRMASTLVGCESYNCSSTPE